MTIAPTCARCHHELTLPGGLLFTPPNASDEVRKYHLCVMCFTIVLETATGLRL